jgi:cytochrome c556
MHLKLSVAALVAIAAVASGVALADGDPIAARQQLMKQNNDAAKLGFQMAKGQVPFDATAAAGAMNQIASDMATLPSLFPPGSESGEKTTASPDIWTSMDDFKALAAKLGTDAKSAADAAGKGQDAFAAAFDVVGEDCGACHKRFRVR